MYHVDKILFRAKNIIFVHDFNIDVTKLAAIPQAIPHLSLPFTEPVERKPRIHCYPPEDALRGELTHATYAEVNKKRNFEVGWTNGWNNVRNCELRLKSASAGLRLYTAEAKRVRGGVEISNTPQAGVIQFSSMQQQSEEPQAPAQFRIPYDLESPSSTSVIAIGMDLIYQTEEGEFKFLLDAVLSTELPLAVNVHDVFKEYVLFSRFQIQTSSPSSSAAGQVPVQITGVELDGLGSDYMIKAPPRMSLPVDVLPEQPLWATYMIAIAEDKGDSRSSSSGKNSTSLNETTSLSLIVQYRHFVAIVMKRIEFVFCKDLVKSRFGRFKWLLLPRLLDRAREFLSRSKSSDNDSGYSVISMSNEVILGLYERYRWNEVILNVAMKDREALGSWLQQWHKVSLADLMMDFQLHSIRFHHHLFTNLGFFFLKENAVIQFRPPNNLETDLLPESEVVINVPMPRVQVLHTVSLITIAEDGSRGTTKMMALGDVLVTELVIKHTRRWDGHHRHYRQNKSCLPSGPTPFSQDGTKEKLRKKGNGNEPRNKTRGKKNTGTACNDDNDINLTADFKPAGDSTIEPGPDNIEFIYEVRADPDNKWVVSGQRRARFTMRARHGGEDEEHRFRMFLIPLVTGELLFPSVDIKVFEEPKYFDPHNITDGEDDGDGRGDSSGIWSGNNDDRSSKKPTITCETDYLSQSEIIVVVPNIRSCTVGVGFSEAGEAGDDESGARPDKREKDDQARTKDEGEEEKERDRLRTERRVETKLLEVEYRTKGFA